MKKNKIFFFFLQKKLNFGPGKNFDLEQFTEFTLYLPLYIQWDRYSPVCESCLADEVAVVPH